MLFQGKGNPTRESLKLDISQDGVNKKFPHYQGDSYTPNMKDLQRRGTSKMLFMAPTIKGIAMRKQEEKQ